MEAIPFDFSEMPEQEIAETVFNSLHGFLVDEYQAGWAKDIFIPGHPCYEAFQEAQRIREQLQCRLGTIREDKELVELMDYMAAYGKQLAIEMFFCGIHYQKSIE